MPQLDPPGMRVPETPAMVRQGDVLLVPVEAIPDGALPVARDRGRVVLAYGEVTGHAHAVDAPGATLLADEADRYLRLRSRAVLAHEEHAAIELAPGAYRVVIQREYQPAPVGTAAWRRVVD
jgi:hypothetical protein